MILCSFQFARWHFTLQYDTTCICTFIHTLQLFVPLPEQFCWLHKFDISIFNTCYLTKRFLRVASYLSSQKSTVSCNRWKICWYSTMFYWCQTRRAWEWSGVGTPREGRVWNLEEIWKLLWVGESKYRTPYINTVSFGRLEPYPKSKTEILSRSRLGLKLKFDKEYRSWNKITALSTPCQQTSLFRNV